MSRRAEFVSYAPKSVLNKGKRADHWFWSRYSAYPYLGCQHGCAFCYCREQKYSPFDSPDDFAYVIKAKQNSPELLRRALSRCTRDVVFTGDYQPAERLFHLSRQMLQVCCDLGFPVMVLERSPLVLRDLDVLQAIQGKARAVVAFSIIYTPESSQAGRCRSLENLAPPPEKRFAAMEKIAAAGILTGTCCMPVLPGLCDDGPSLESVVRWTADHGGQFVLSGSLTLADQQRDFFFRILGQHFPDLLDRYQRLYPPGSYAPVHQDWLAVARRIAEFCDRYGIRDRMPRPVIPGEKREFNKRLVEKLADRAYLLEITQQPDSRVWAYRRAAWAVEDLEQDVRLVYQRMGRKGLEQIPGLSGVIIGEIEPQLREESGYKDESAKDSLKLG